MAAHIVATAWCLNGRFYVWTIFMYVLGTLGRADHTYSRHELLNIGLCCDGQVSSEIIRLHKILMEVARSPCPLRFAIRSRGQVTEAATQITAPQLIPLQHHIPHKRHG